VQDSAVDILKC